MKKKLFAKGFVKKVKDNGVIVGAVASTGSTDRDGEILDPKGWDLKAFKKSPRLLWAHQAHALPIGKVTDIGIDKKERLVFDAELAEKEDDFAKKVANLIRGGFINSFSVGFRSTNFDRETNTFKKMELLEISLVNVPANAEARLSHEYKSFMKAEKKMFKKKDKSVIHQKPVEEDEKRIRIKVNTCKVTATIDIDKKQGISALYCGKVKKIRTYIFLKAKKWTVAKAKKWVEDHHQRDVDIILIKAGRVISEKNRMLIRNAITALKELLRMSEAPKASKGGKKVGPRRAQEDKVALEALRIVDRAIEMAIHKVKEKP